MIKAVNCHVVLLCLLMLKHCGSSSEISSGFSLTNIESQSWTAVTGFLSVTAPLSQVSIELIYDMTWRNDNVAHRLATGAYIMQM